MRLKLTILLVILNVALFSYILYFKKVQSTRTLFDNNNRLILDTGFVQDIDQIQFSSIHIDDPWILEKADDQWLVDSPVQWKANPFAVQQLLFQLRRLSWESRFAVKDVIASGRSLQSYNLENPPIRINLSQEGRSLTLALGAPTEIGNRLYLMSPDGEFIYVVNRTLLDIMQRDLESFLDQRVFGIAARSIRGVQIQDRSRSNVRGIRLERQEANWEFVSPIATRADKDKVEAFIQKWQSLEIKGFETGEGAVESLPGEALKLTLEGMGRREILHLAPYPDGEGEDLYLAKHEDYPALFTVSASLVKGLRTTQEDLRESRILSGFSHDWTSLEIQMDTLTVTLQELEGGGWQVLYTDTDGQLTSTPAAEESIAKLKELLESAEAEQFVSDAPSEVDIARYGLKNPQRKVILRMSSGTLVEFEIGEAYPDSETTYLYARTNQSNSVFLVRPYILAELSLNPLHYRDRNIRILPETVILEDIDLIIHNNGNSLLAEAAADQSILREQLENYLRSTRVDRFLNREFADPLPLDATENLDWDFVMQARPVYPNSPEEQAEPIRLFLSRRLGGTTQYVGDPETGLVGTLPLPLIEALDPVLTTNPEEPEPIEEIEEPAGVPQGS